MVTDTMVVHVVVPARDSLVAGDWVPGWAACQAAWVAWGALAVVEALGWEVWEVMVTDMMVLNVMDAVLGEEVFLPPQAVGRPFAKGWKLVK